MKFTSELLKKSWSIYRNIKKACPNIRHRFAWSKALKDALKFFRALKRGIVGFIKFDGTETIRRIAPLTLLGYDTESGEGSIFKVVDLDKVESGSKNAVISFHNYQMI